jgi:arabinan endo-1,5-alpha-L-arabinosidase
VIGLAECERFDPERPLEGWVDKGLVYETKPGDPINAIDPEVIVAEDGRHWMYFGSYWSGIHVTELDPKTGMLRNADRPNPICVAKNLIEQGDPIEGAAVLQRNGFYYLFVSYGLAAQGVRSSYRIMVGRSKSPTGPFEDQNGKAMSDGGYVSVLKTSPPMMSPGHCDVLKLNDGRYVMPYHFYDARRIWHGDTWGLPTLQIRELLWSSDDWPLPGLPIEFERAKTEKSVIGTWTHQVDFGQPSVVELTADGKATNDRNHGTWTLKGDELVVSWPRQDAPGRFWLDKLKVAYGNTYYVGRNDAGLIIRGVRVPKGG